MAFLPEVRLDDAEAVAVGHGRPVPGRRPADDHVRITHDGRLIAIGRADGENLRPEVVIV